MRAMMITLSYHRIIGMQPIEMSEPAKHAVSKGPPTSSLRHSHRAHSLTYGIVLAANGDRRAATLFSKLLAGHTVREETYQADPDPRPIPVMGAQAMPTGRLRSCTTRPRAPSSTDASELLAEVTWLQHWMGPVLQLCGAGVFGMGLAVARIASAESVKRRDIMVDMAAGSVGGGAQMMVC